MLTKRIITALLMGPIIFAAIWWGTYTSSGAMFCGLALFFLYEYWRIMGGLQTVGRAEGLDASIFCLIGLSPGVVGILAGRPLPFWMWIFWYLLLDHIVVLMRYESMKKPFTRMALASFGHLYIGLFLYSVLTLLGMDKANLLLIYLFICVFSGDIFAYFGGKGLGRHKLCPRVSPKKTVEGAISGLVASVVLGTFGGLAMEVGLSLWAMVGASMALGVVGQLGDLLESGFKRTFGKKDSGALLPGHGGFLDRFDGVILATPCLLLILQVT